MAVVTTSGTAAAELLPACIEAYYQALPLILVTADRPERYRGSGAPQAIEQEGLFGVYAARFDLSEPELPTQLEKPLKMPLEEPPKKRLVERLKRKLVELQSRMLELVKRLKK